MGAVSGDMETPKIRPLSPAEVTFTVKVEPELYEPEDSGMDEEAAKIIRKRVDEGDEMAWCTIVLRAEWGGMVGEATLGGCSYEDREEFEHDEYYLSMRQDALDELNEEVAAMARRISQLAE